MRICRLLSMSLILAIAAFLAISRCSSAATINVPADYATIGAAVTAASDGDTIVLAPGTYNSGGDLDLTIGKSLTFESSGTAANTIIDCNGSNEFIQQLSSDNLDLTFQNLTFQDGNLILLNVTGHNSNTIDLNGCVFTDLSGYILETDAANDISLTDCTINDNTSFILFGLTGGTMSVTSSTFSNNTGCDFLTDQITGTITGCTFDSNGTGGPFGGLSAIFWQDAPLTIVDTSFTDNQAGEGGGAIGVNAATHDSPLTLNRCTFAGNAITSDPGGAVYLQPNGADTSLVASDCVFVGNSSDVDGGAIGGGGNMQLVNCSFYGNSYSSGPPSGQGTISSDGNSTLTITNSILYGDTTSKEISTISPASTTAVTYSDVEGYISGVNNNIAADPMYAAPASGDLHISMGSPCVQAGTSTGAPSTDTDQYAWGNAVSMGAYSPIGFQLSTPLYAIAGLSSPFTVTALAADNTTTITNYAGTVHFTSSDAAASLPADTTLTNGVDTLDATLNTLGSQTITATDASTTAITGTSAGITVTGPATHFVLTNPGPQTAGSSFTFTVTAKDANGNTAGTYSGTVHFTSSDPAASLPADTTLTDGVGTFNATLDTAGNQTITATDTVTSSITGATTTIDVSPGSTAAFQESLPGVVTAGTPFDMTVTAVDSFGNTTPTYSGTIHYTASDPQAVLPPDGGLTNGTGTVSVTFKTAGWNNVQLDDAANGVSGGTPNSLVLPATASQFTIVAPTPVTAGTPQTITVTALDPYGNQATSDIVHFTSTDSSATLPADTQISGQQTFSVTFATAGNQTITLTDTTDPSTTATSNTVTVDPGPAAQLAVTAPSTATAGTPFNFTVTAKDSYGNATTTYTGTVHFTSSDSAANLPADAALTNGTGTFSSTLKTAGSRTITAMDTITSSITGTSNSIAVSGGPATHFTVDGPSTATFGVASTYTVTALDAFGNTSTGYTGTVHFASNAPTQTAPANSRLTNGTGQFAITIRSLGSFTLTATDVVTTSITGSAPVAVSANTLKSFSTGWQMISAPADYTGFTMSRIFSPAPAAVDWWNPSTKAYAVSPMAPADTIRPGIGYWANFAQSTSLLDIGTHTNPSTPVTVDLSAGWNMIGNPFNVPVNLTTGVTVSTGTTDSSPFYYATHSGGLLSPDLFTFAAGASTYTVETSTLQPYTGYWIYAYAPCTLSISGS